MSQANVEIVRNAFQIFGAEGIDAALPFFSPDLVWYPTDRWLDGSAYRGHDGMRRLSAAFSENFDDFRYDVHDIREAQDGVCRACRDEGTYQALGVRGPVNDSGSWFRASATERFARFVRFRVGPRPSKLRAWRGR